MKKVYYVYAEWRKKDVAFINTLKTISKKIELGSDHFSIEDGKYFDKFIELYSKKDSLFSKTKPKEFRIQQANCIFSKEELDKADYYALYSIGDEPPESRYPQPNKKREYVKEVFDGSFYKYGDYYGVNKKKQITSFKIKKTKWKKNEICFNLGLEYEYILFKKGFYQEVLAPLGLQCMEVLDYKTNKPLESTVQLVIPIAKSKLLLEKSAYDIHSLEETDGYKQYALQTLDFFPSFEKEFNFHICYSQEYFYGGFQRIIISKEFCNLLVKHKIIKYNTWTLTPLKN